MRSRLTYCTSAMPVWRRKLREKAPGDEAGDRGEVALAERLGQVLVDIGERLVDARRT